MSVQNSRVVIDHLLVQRLDMGNRSRRECVMDGLRRADTARKVKFLGFTPLVSLLQASLAQPASRHTRICVDFLQMRC